MPLVTVWWIITPLTGPQAPARSRLWVRQPGRSTTVTPSARRAARSRSGVRGVAMKVSFRKAGRPRAGGSRRGARGAGGAGAGRRGRAGGGGSRARRRRGRGQESAAQIALESAVTDDGVNDAGSAV